MVFARLNNHHPHFFFPSPPHPPIPQTTLTEKYNKSMSLKEAEVLALSTLKQVMEEKLSDINVEISVATTQGFKIYTRAETAAIIARMDAAGDS